MYAVVKVAGHQYRMVPNETLLLPRLANAVGETVALDGVLYLCEGERVVVGTPTIPGAKVEIQIVEHPLGDRIRIYKKKRRSSYQRKRGHRQPLTLVRVMRVAGRAAAA